ncbi:hypothetical protein ACW95P_03510 [Candidatus Mycoplasma pogonae]
MHYFKQNYKRNDDILLNDNWWINPNQLQKQKLYFNSRETNKDIYGFVNVIYRKNLLSIFPQKYTQKQHWIKILQLFLLTNVFWTWITNLWILTIIFGCFWFLIFVVDCFIFLLKQKHILSQTKNDLEQLFPNNNDWKKYFKYKKIIFLYNHFIFIESLTDLYFLIKNWGNDDI